MMNVNLLDWAAKLKKYISIFKTKVFILSVSRVQQAVPIIFAVATVTNISGSLLRQYEPKRSLVNPMFMVLSLSGLPKYLNYRYLSQMVSELKVSQCMSTWNLIDLTFVPISVTFEIQSEKRKIC